MLFRLSLVWVSFMVPWLLSGLIGGPTGMLPHAVFHVGYLVFIALTVTLLVRLRQSTSHRGVRALSLITAVVYSIAGIGQVGELAIVMMHGGLDAPDHLLEEPDHLAFAMVSLPGLFLTVLLLVALGAVAAISSIRHGDALGWVALAPSVVFLVEFVIALAGFIPARLGLVATLTTIVFAIVAGMSRRRHPAETHDGEPAVAVAR